MKTQATAVTVSDNGAFIFHNGKYMSVGATHPNLNSIKDAIRDGEYDKALMLMDISYGMNEWAKKSAGSAGTVGFGLDFIIDKGIVKLKGKAFSEAVSKKVITMMSAGQDADSLIKFLYKTRENLSNVAQDELLLFCQANDFLIHEDGDIIAFKGIKSNWFDMYSGKFDNHVGNTVEMKRGNVDDRRNKTCSHGLHFGSLEYATNFGQKVVVVKVNPKDVVSIPEDYANQKGRCCRYVVLSELEDKVPPVRKEVYKTDDFTSHGGNVKRCRDCGWSLSEDDITYYIDTCRMCHTR